MEHALSFITGRKILSQPTHGIEPWTFSLRMKCSTTELCGLYHSIIFLTHHICSTWFPMTFLIAHTGWRWYSMTFLTAHTQYSNHGIYITNKIVYHWAIWTLLRVEASSLHNFYSWMVWKILCTHSCLQSYVFAWMRMFSNLQTLTFSLCRKKMSSWQPQSLPVSMFVVVGGWRKWEVTAPSQ